MHIFGLVSNTVQSFICVTKNYSIFSHEDIYIHTFVKFYIVRVLRYFESFMIECFHLLKFSYKFFFLPIFLSFHIKKSQVHDSFFFSLSFISLHHPLPIHTKQLKRKFVRFASNLGSSTSCI